MMWKKTISALLALALCAGLCEPAALATEGGAGSAPEIPVLMPANSAEAGRQTLNFNEDWRFHLGDVKGADGKNFDDSDWRTLNLPHDYSIEQDFNPDSPARGTGAYLDGGVGWYRKTCVLPESMSDKRFYLHFDGVYMDSTVYVNGTMIGNFPDGYAPFTYDITDALVVDGVTENIIAVRVNNQQPSSRWYSGSGIYRDVTMIVTEDIHIADNGTYVTTPQIETEYTSGNPVTVHVETEVSNDSPASAEVTVRHSIHFKGSDEIAATAETKPVTVDADTTEKINLDLAVQNPTLWRSGVGGLYVVHTEILANGETVDTYDTEFGFRWFTFDPDEGFFLNGEYMKLHGMCMHHDQGALGAVSNPVALDRQIRILREMGVNAIRSTHNAASSDMLDACNEQGILLIDEAYDCWWQGKNPYDFGRFFEKAATHPDAEPGQTWGEFTIKNLVDEAKNDPCVMLWSLGNEIQQILTEKCPDVAQQLKTWVYEVDSSRGVTIGDSYIQVEYPFNEYHEATDELMDAVGFNYGNFSNYDKAHQDHPDWFIYGSENASAISSRGYYYHPENDWHTGKHPEDMQLSSYDNDCVGWGSPAWYALKNDRDRKWLGGLFIWTGFDYLGEAPYGWPSKTAQFGVVDTCGFPKDTYYLYQSQWRSVEDYPMVHILPHWNWADDHSIEIDGKIPVRIYSNAPSVELFLNGKSLGKQSFVQKVTDYGMPYQESEDDKLWLQWLVPFEEGTIVAKAYDENGTVIAEDTMSTAGEPAALKLMPESEVITANGEDLCYIPVDVVDENGVMVPDADNYIQFSIRGNGRIVGVDNGNTLSVDSLKGSGYSAFSGKALVIVQATKTAGSFTVTASSAGLERDSVTVYTVDDPQGDNVLLGYDPISVKTTVGTAPALPETVTAVYLDGSRMEKAVTWSEIPADKLEKAGLFYVTGTVDETGDMVTVSVEVVDVVGVKPVSVVTLLNTQPELPEQVTVIYSDGAETSQTVQWDEIPVDKLSQIGLFTVAGTVTELGLKAEAQVRVTENNVTERENIALRQAGQAYPKAIASVETAGDPLAGINDGVISFDQSSLKNGWGNWPSTTPDDVDWAGIEWGEPMPVDNISLYFLENNGIYIPQNTVIEYWDGSNWKAVQEQSATGGFVSGERQEITFQPVETTKLRAVFTRGENGKKNCMVVAEMEIYAALKDTGSATAALEELLIGGVPLEGFSPDKLSYSVRLPFGAEVPEITAKAADNGTVFVLPAISANDAASIQVTSENGLVSTTYVVQFVEDAAAIESAEVWLDAEELHEDDIVSLHIRAFLQGGTLADEDELGVVYRILPESTAQAEIKNGQLYAYGEGELLLEADVTYQNKTVTTPILSCKVGPSEFQKTVLSYAKVEVTTAPGQAPVLPAAVRATFDVGLPKDVAVVWDNIDPAQYAECGTFVVSGTVENQQLRPTATVYVVDYIAAENQSVATALGVPPVLPDQVSVFKNDGTSVYSAVTWDEYNPQLLKEVQTFDISGTTELGNLPVSISVRVTDDCITSENYAQTRSGFELSKAMASYTNPGNTDRIYYLNDGTVHSVSDTPNNEKKIWCDWQNPYGKDPWVGIIFGVDVPEMRYIDTLELYTYNEHVPETCEVEYYVGEIKPEDIPEKVNELDDPSLQDHPFNNPENWRPVENLVLPESFTEGGMSTISFDMVGTYAVRLKMTYSHSGLELSELKAFGKSPRRYADFTVTDIAVNGASIDGFDPATK